ncbi:hypothetical protein [Streptomyces sp. AS02]|uniref:hypothetical protein n=1 Tax=Streptomyces sp. AS02 TaxID=2938946 RepID=UPI0020213CC5|nr:hypothetical protein [Streptomyces sp. AS02]MCL8015862.1 hypothetical protein [Streptomyces sp. AS02]
MSSDGVVVDAAVRPGANVTGVLMAPRWAWTWSPDATSSGSSFPQEAVPLSFVVWLLADLYDTLVDQPGATDLIMQDTFDSLATETG